MILHEPYNNRYTVVLSQVLYGNMEEGLIPQYYQAESQSRYYQWFHCDVEDIIL